MKSIKLTLMAALGVLPRHSVSGKKCTIIDDLKTSLSECHPTTQFATAHFYYDNYANCDDERELDPETDEIVKEGSDPIPPYF